MTTYFEVDLDVYNKREILVEACGSICDNVKEVTEYIVDKMSYLHDGDRICVNIIKRVQKG